MIQNESLNLHNEWARAAGVAALCGLWQALTLRHGHNWGDDFAQYILHASNILDGVGYGSFSWTLDTDNWLFFPGNYPPGFPVLLTSVIGLFGMNLVAMKLLNVALFTVALMTAYFCFRRFLPAKYTVATMAIVGMNPFLWEFKDNVLSDVPFLLFVYCTIILLRFLENTFEQQLQIKRVALASAAIIGAYSMRNAGIVLLAVPMLVEIARFRRVSWNSLLITATAACGILLLSRSFETHGGYYASTYGVIRNWASSLRQAIDYGYDLALIWDNTRSRKAFYLLSLVMSALAASGFFSRIRRKRFGVFEAFVLCYMPIVVFWPSYQSTRFLIPIIPLYVFYAMISIDNIETWAKRKERIASLRFAPLLLVLAMVTIAYSLKYTHPSLWRISDNITSHDSVALASWIRTHVSDCGRIAFRKPRALALITGKKTTSYYKCEDDAKAIAYLTNEGVTHVVSSGLFDDDWTFFRPLLLRHPEVFTTVFENPSFTVKSLARSAIRQTGDTASCSKELSRFTARPFLISE